MDPQDSHTDYSTLPSSGESSSETATPPLESLPSSVSSDDEAKRIEQNFRRMAILFGANHGCVVACISLATARFGSVGAWQSGILYLFYTGSAMFGSTYFVKKLGGRDGLLTGMGLYCCYVLAFLLATLLPESQRTIAYIGAAIGGSGAGFLWTAQGSYFATAAAKHAEALNQPVEQSTNSFSSVFAFYYLAFEVLLRGISSLSGSVKAISWTVIFTVYFLVAVVTTISMLWVQKFKVSTPNSNESPTDALSSNSTWWYKSTVTVQMLFNEPKMKYMIGLNAVFGFANAFLNSYVNGQVVQTVFNNDNMIGILTAGQAVLAASLTMVFGHIGEKFGKGTVLILGSISFAFVAVPFVVFPTTASWSPIFLFFVYAMQASGRATFEGPLKSVFADFFPEEKEGAFANIILQNGSATALGFALSSGYTCDHEASRYCIRFHDGSLHNLVPFEWMVIGSAVVAILGYLVAASMHEESKRNFVSLPQEDVEESKRNFVSLPQQVCTRNP
eukprot:CAMPEP_0168827518 /NCGR_PEP_ID=MMETSP0727-20121128/40_1 /TAXON_ID=265536 /ORGANISM="Amphiprora sp., Strain CCMP467" /LENGTH=503 /DNA_ID=CAMNT_0008880687 /DNA_START=30 /DNA_END=1538 /DNA_ORIENTATION=+